MPEENNEPGEEETEENENQVFTQDEVTKLIRREVGETKRKTMKSLLEELGAEDVDELKTLVTKAKRPAPKKPADKETDADDKGGEVDVEEITRNIKNDYQKELDEINLSHEIESMIVDRYGTTARAAKKLRKLVDVELDAEEDEIIVALEDLEKDMPNLFTKDEGEDDSGRESSGQLDRERRSRNSNPGRSPRSPRGKGSDPKSAARTLLHERHPQTRQNN